jgi:molecular chaperone DnaK
MTARGPILGLDFGTTNSCVAAIVDGRARVLADRDGERVTPTVVAFTPQGEIVGRPARRFMITDPENTVFSFKRLLGRTIRDPAARVAMSALPYKIVAGPNDSAVIRARGQLFSVPEVAARVLGAMRAIAVDRLGVDVRQAVITVPASFEEEQRAAVRIAGRIAGLDDVDLLDEPTAAALAFGHDCREEGRLCVYDFGGGTIDVSILMLENRTLRVVATAGDPLLGGDDLDRELAQAVAEVFRGETGRSLWRDVAEWQRLLMACEEAKRRLSVQPNTVIKLRDVARTPTGGRDLSYVLDRARFHQICGETVERTLAVCTEALRRAGLAAADIDRTVLVGGSTLVKLVRTRVAELFGKAPDISADPLEAVAVGAAIYGARASKVITDNPRA